MAALILSVSLAQAATLGRVHAQGTSASSAVSSSGDISGTVKSAKGPEAGVWVIAETTDTPTRYTKIVVSDDSGRYLIPAIKQLPGLIHFYAGVSPEGSTVHVSVWDSGEHAAQLDHLKEMVVIARGEAEAVGVTFRPIVNYPINWTI